MEDKADLIYYIQHVGQSKDLLDISRARIQHVEIRVDVKYSGRALSFLIGGQDLRATICRSVVLTVFSQAEFGTYRWDGVTLAGLTCRWENKENSSFS